jgi:hypothetical protein
LTVAARSTEDVREAVALIGDLLAVLRSETDPDPGTRNIIEAMEDEEARLISSLVEPRAYGHRTA